MSAAVKTVSGSILALIPARGQSKRIPRKNLVPVAGKPLIAWTIEQAMAVGEFQRVLVSTDDPEIAEVARHFGAEVPFMRPAALATDEADSYGVAAHALRWLAGTGGTLPELVCLLQPTSPLRTAADILGVIELQRVRSAVAVVSVCRPSHRPSWFHRIGPAGELIAWLPAQKPDDDRRDKSLYLLNGSIYLVRTETLLHQRTFAPSGSIAYVMPLERSLDVDQPWELYVADLVLRERGRLVHDGPADGSRPDGCRVGEVIR